MKYKKIITILVIIIFLLFFNKILGETLGLVGNCKAIKDRENRVKIYTNCQGFTNKFIIEVLHARAFTLDHVILTNKDTLSASTYSHELAHTKQYTYFGPLFLPLYGVAQLVALADSEISGYQNPQAGNIFEIWANKIAGLPLSRKIPK